MLDPSITEILRIMELNLKLLYVVIKLNYLHELQVYELERTEIKEKK